MSGSVDLHIPQTSDDAYALVWSHPSPRRVEHAVGRLLATLDDRSLPSDVRGLAAEGLGVHLYSSTRRRLRRSAITTALRHLSDPSAEVRFWCCYALGQIGDRSAKRPLIGLLADDAHVERWWTVGEEARNALLALETGCWPDLDPLERALLS
jgi:hypothetical protein